MGINIRRTYNHPDSQEHLLGKFSRTQDTEDNPFTLQIANRLISLNVKQEEHHWWSPEMTLRLENEENNTAIYEVIGPNSSMFTLAMFFVTLGSVVFLAALMMSLSQMTVGESPLLAVVATILSGLLIIVTFGVLAIGRMKATNQVSTLRQFVGDIIDS
ncbi:MAG: hypothetical protein HOD43_09345 [Candidatus Marinimicrobia bacterium]|nr:hypothetical protein [Candidatus Neomarinimicrobiota bacterium]MBT3823963.1 hypothetical protein [Candidatus Neomarinimicrobiota bacterium]MBT4033767.1 hypothetical protein [Candidatus Neomarinimicrobiota bacterium]MBT4295993.1 hypothetical protein [Candidatus Neomarinimicrobiota bacterium]MBT4419821.1 hypothetical protein [Candidatus Neomarinimicrobiota bacterium]